MCCEDIRIGLNSLTNEVRVTGTAASQLIAPPDLNRIAIVLFGVSAGTFHVTSLGTAVVGQGIVVTPTGPAQVLSVKDYGKAIQGPWYGISDMAGRVLSVAFITSRYCREDQRSE